MQKHDNIIKRQIFLSQSGTGDICVYKILRFRIDGYRNIKNTEVTLHEPVTVFLAPNNYGKSNLLKAIEWAVDLVGLGKEMQADIIRLNKYTSHNIVTPGNGDGKKRPSLEFEIEFQSNDYKIAYGFHVSPYKGVLSEFLKVGRVEIFSRNRKHDIDNIKHDEIEIGNTTLNIGFYNLLASELTTSILMSDSSGKIFEPIGVHTRSPNEIADAIRYVDIVRKFFNVMRNMFCNRESPRGSYNSDEKRKPSNIVHNILTLYKSDKDLYRDFKKTFLGLFNNQIKDFNVYDSQHRKLDDSDFSSDGRSDDDAFLLDFNSSDYRPESYRLEFSSFGKAREYFGDLSSGTQDIFLIFLEVFSRDKNPLIVIEELENGIHPSLYTRVLKSLYRLCETKRALVTTHSPTVVRHFDTSFASFYIGIPDKNGFATFAALNKNKEDEIQRRADFHNISIGELLIDMMSESDHSSDILREWLSD